MKSQTYVLHNEGIRQSFVRLVLGLKLDKPWKITVGLHKDHRSIEQNKRMWLINTAIADYTGYSPTEQHQINVEAILGLRAREVKGRVYYVRPETSLMDVAEMSEYMQQLEAWAAQEFGVFLPAEEGVYER